MKTIYLIRHCKAEGQQPEAPLTAEGKEQADEIAAFFEATPIDYIISSPFLRAVHTIKPLSNRKGLPIHTDSRLSERVLSSKTDLPDWLEQLEETFHNLELTLSGGESSSEAMSRAVAVLHELLEREEENIAVVSHGNLLALLLKYIDSRYGFQEWKTMSNPDVYALTYHSHTPTLKRIWGRFYPPK